jgi:hypothetical protein
LLRSYAKEFGASAQAVGLAGKTVGRRALSPDSQVRGYVGLSIYDRLGAMLRSIGVFLPLRRIVRGKAPKPSRDASHEPVLT